MASGNFAFGIYTANDLGFSGDKDLYPHNYVSFNLAPILTNLGVATLDFKAHFTMECGNDEFEGEGTIVTESATLMLMGVGLIGLAGFGRKRDKKQA